MSPHDETYRRVRVCLSTGGGGQRDGEHHVVGAGSGSEAVAVEVRREASFLRSRDASTPALSQRADVDLTILSRNNASAPLDDHVT